MGLIGSFNSFTHVIKQRKDTYSHLKVIGLIEGTQNVEGFFLSERQEVELKR